MMAGLSLLGGVFMRPLIFLAVTLPLFCLFWVGCSHGSYITIYDKNVYGTVFFIRGRVTPISDIVSIRRNPIFAGLMAEVLMKVRRKDGTIAERGLANKPGLTEGDFMRLLETIRSANPKVAIDQELFAK